MHSRRYPVPHMLKTGFGDRFFVSDRDGNGKKQRFTGDRAEHAESAEPFPRSAEESHAAHGEVGGEGAADRDQADAA